MDGHRWWKEPLLHFLILAAGLFAVQRYWSPQPTAERPDEIVVTQQRINSFALTFQRTWQRPPTQEELDGLIDDYIRDEVFYREALQMGLDRDDTLIRRRMRQKLEFLAEDFADAIQPTQQQLQEYLDGHPQAFRVQRLTSFRQVFLNPRQRGEELAGDADIMLQQLESESEQVIPEDLGDPILLPHDNINLRERQITDQYGQEFAAQLQTVEPGHWNGPIESAYGSHLVYVIEQSPERTPELDEVRSDVEREWFAERRSESKQEFFNTLMKKYAVTIEQPEATDHESVIAE